MEECPPEFIIGHPLNLLLEDRIDRQSLLFTHHASSSIIDTEKLLILENNREKKTFFGGRGGGRMNPEKIERESH